MKTLRVRAHPIPKKARDGYVQVHVGGRWASNRDFYLTCNRWTEGVGYSCPVHANPSLDNVEFVELEDNTDCDEAEATGIKPWRVAFGTVCRRCKVCGKLFPTGYGYNPPGSSIPLASRKPRWPR